MLHPTPLNGRCIVAVLGLWQQLFSITLEQKRMDTYHKKYEVLMIANFAMLIDHEYKLSWESYKLWWIYYSIGAKYL